MIEKTTVQNGFVEVRSTSGQDHLDLPDGEEFYQEVLALAEAVKKEHIDQGVHTFFANIVEKVLVPMAATVRGVAIAEAPAPMRQALASFQYLFARRRQGRYVDFFERQKVYGTEVPGYLITASQGVPGYPCWRGIPLFKSVYEQALYPMMLGELKPGTIFETGSANGGSAVWLADQATALGLKTHIYTVDLKRPEPSHPSVTFIEGDCNEIGEAFPAALLARAPHPWLFLEDAHVNVVGVLEHFFRAAQEGDYFVVEDTESHGKMAEITTFAHDHHNEFKVDTRYTDFYGYNATCSIDTIWRIG